MATLGSVNPGGRTLAWPGGWLPSGGLAVWVAPHPRGAGAGRVVLCRADGRQKGYPRPVGLGVAFVPLAERLPSGPSASGSRSCRLVLGPALLPGGCGPSGRCALSPFPLSRRWLRRRASASEGRLRPRRLHPCQNDWGRGATAPLRTTAPLSEEEPADSNYHRQILPHPRCLLASLSFPAF